MVLREIYKIFLTNKVDMEIHVQVYPFLLNIRE